MEPTIYETLGVGPVINAAGNVTAVGGSRMSENTIARMKEAAASYVDLEQLQQALHERIAAMTRNEAAYISNGAASGLYLALAACLADKIKLPFNRIPTEQISSKEVVIFTAHRNPYDWVIRQLGMKPVQVGYPNAIDPLSPNDLVQAISEETAAVYYVAGSEGGWIAKGAMPLSEVIPVAQKKGVPVVVDAAAQLPPVDNLWRFTAQGADAVVFSGGKDIAGPQASGLIVGKKKLLRTVQQIGFPHYGIGRIMKVGREEMVGLYAALQQYLETDHEARLAGYEKQIETLAEGLNDSELYHVERAFPNESGQPVPRGFVRIIRPDKLSPKGLKQRLMDGKPRIYTVLDGAPGIYLNPMTMRQAEWHAVICRLQEIEAEVTDGEHH
jgi:D-glucosaminate-6-phosphate ammonia-lyase